MRGFWGRYDLFIAVVAVGLAVLAGTVIGSISGFIGGAFDNLLMRRWCSPPS